MAKWFDSGELPRNFAPPVAEKHRSPTVMLKECVGIGPDSKTCPLGIPTQPEQL